MARNLDLADLPSLAGDAGKRLAEATANLARLEAARAAALARKSDAESAHRAAVASGRYRRSSATARVVLAAGGERSTTDVASLVDLKAAADEAGAEARDLGGVIEDQRAEIVKLCGAAASKVARAPDVLAFVAEQGKALVNALRAADAAIVALEQLEDAFVREGWSGDLVALAREAPARFCAPRPDGDGTSTVERLEVLFRRFAGR